MLFSWLIFYFLSLLFIAANTVIYPGFLDSFATYIDIVNLIFIILSARIFYLNTPIPSIFVKFNRALLYLSGISFLFFALLEQMNYENFVYSTFSLHFYDLIFLFLVAYLVRLTTIGVDAFISKFESYLLELGLVLLLVWGFLPLRLYDYHIHLGREDGFLENIQAGLYFLIFLLAAFQGKRLRLQDQNFLSTVFYLLSLFGLFVFFEEISWGQRFFNFELEQLQSSSTKNEINVHNQVGVQFILKYAYILIGLYGLLSRKMTRLITQSKSSKSWIIYLTPSGYLFPFFLLIVPVYLGVIPIDRIYQEVYAEMLLAMGICFHLIQNLIPMKLKGIV